MSCVELVSGQVSAYCYNGECPTHRSQCRLWWGKDADNAHDDCYTTINVRGEYGANCGYNFTAETVFPCSSTYVYTQYFHWLDYKLR